MWEAMAGGRWQVASGKWNRRRRQATVNNVEPTPRCGLPHGWPLVMIPCAWAMFTKGGKKEGDRKRLQFATLLLNIVNK